MYILCYERCLPIWHIPLPTVAFLEGTGKFNMGNKLSDYCKFVEQKKKNSKLIAEYYNTFSIPVTASTFQIRRRRITINLHL